MATTDGLDREHVIAVLDAVDWNTTAAASRLGIPRTTLQSYMAREGVCQDHDDAEMCSVTMGDDSGSVHIKSATIRTLDDAIKAAHVDLDVWEVERHVVNKWDQGSKGPDGKPQVVELWQIKVWLRRRVPRFYQNLGEHIIERMKAHRPKYRTVKRRQIERPHMLEISIYDTHFGKLAWQPETGNDYDLKIAERLFVNATQRFLDLCKHVEIEKVLFPLGNDFFHLNDQTNATPKSRNQLDVDSRLFKIYEVGFRAVVAAIDMCRVVAPVDIPWVPGNHDPELSWFLAHAIQAWYSETDDVTVDTSPKSRKFRRFGTSLIVFTHQDEEPPRDLPGIVLGEAASLNLLDGVDRVEIHAGHFHKQKEVRWVATDTFGGGVVVRTIPSMSGHDAWHYRKGYMSERAAEAHLWDRQHGCVAHLRASVDSLEA